MQNAITTINYTNNIPNTNAIDTPWRIHNQRADKKITNCRTFRCSGQNSHFWQLWPISLFFLFYLSFTLYSIFILLNLMSFLFIPCYSFVISVANDLPGHTSPTSFIPHTAYSCPRVPKWNRFSIERIDSPARCCCSFLYY